MYLEVKDLIKYYNPNIQLIKKINFSVNKGELISFIGESGCGKTTFLKCLSGLEKINDGQIILNNEVLNDKVTFVKPQKRKVSYIFQDYPLFPHLNLKENITFNLDSIYEKNLSYMLSLTNLENLQFRYPHQLSGGEQQRACIARSLIREPDLLLMDEPFSNLDNSIKESIIDEIYKIIRHTKTTTILVTHDIKDALNISDRILVFKAGIIQQYADPIKLYCEPANCYCAKILGDINQITFDHEVRFIRPEKFKVVDNSDYSVLVEKSYFQGNIYKIKGILENLPCHFFSKKPYPRNSKVCVSFEEKDLIFFDSLCLSYFK